MAETKVLDMKILDLWAIDLDQSEETLCRWWNTFNFWNWPEDLSDLKPSNYDDWAPNRKHTYIHPIMRAIYDKVPIKTLLKWHHVHNLGWTEARSDAWWGSENV
jgi:hypothetical protein